MSELWNTLVSDFQEIFPFERIGQAIESVSGSITEYISKPAILPSLWNMLPRDITSFVLACFAVILAVTLVVNLLGR